MDLVIYGKRRFSEFEDLQQLRGSMLPHETTSFPEAFCCRALLRCWSLPIPRNWNTRSAWLKSRTRAGQLGDFPGFCGFGRPSVNSSIVFSFCRSSCDLPATMQPCQNWLRGRSLPQNLKIQVQRRICGSCQGNSITRSFGRP